MVRRWIPHFLLFTFHCALSASMLMMPSTLSLKVNTPFAVQLLEGSVTAMPDGESKSVWRS